MNGEVGDSDNLLKQFNAAIYDDIKQTMDEADKTMIEKSKRLAYENLTNKFEKINQKDN